MQKVWKFEKNSKLNYSPTNNSNFFEHATHKTIVHQWIIPKLWGCSLVNMLNPSINCQQIALMSINDRFQIGECLIFVNEQLLLTFFFFIYKLKNGWFKKNPNDGWTHLHVDEKNWKKIKIRRSCGKFGLVPNLPTRFKNRIK